MTIANVTQGLSQWGGDHVVFSLFLWRCIPQGSIWVLPCSRVGHMFRDVQPYPVSVDQVVENYHRVAKAWLGVGFFIPTMDECSAARVQLWYS